MMILGFDPGASTGVATFMNGQLTHLCTIEPHEIGGFISLRLPDRVVFEDSRLSSYSWNTNASRPAALKMARNLGEIDAWCRLITATCENLGIPCHGISPKGKGPKLDAAQFLRTTGWEDKSNQHERDAAMVAWPYRNAAPEKPLMVQAMSKMHNV